jgi:hypothetical protein
MTCVTCGSPVKSDNRSGQCIACRTVKCAYAGCERMVMKRTVRNTYCKEHSHKRRYLNVEAKFAEGM